jgi:hydroxymethylbilane synthase
MVLRAHSRPLRIATRASELALFQANAVAAGLSAVGVASEIVPFHTKGDAIVDRPLAAIGDKGLFTRELEEALYAGAVDCCVHSLKDLPTTSPGGLTIGAHLTREDPRDVLIANPSLHVRSLVDIPYGARVGTSSPRRRWQLSDRRPDLEIVDLRGNVPTRIKKVMAGVVDVAILAAAGVRRLKLTEHIACSLDAPAWLPAPGQGVIAVQIRADDVVAREAIEQLNDRDAATAAIAERSVLAALEGGCQLPLGALLVADAQNESPAVLHAFLASPDSGAIVRSFVPLLDSPEFTGRVLAATLHEQLLASHAGVS